MKKLILFALVAFIGLGLTSCKYEEGPFVSVVPKQERVTNTWEVQEAYENDQPTNDLDFIKEFTLYKEGNADMLQTIAGLDVYFVGTWAFDDDKSHINVTLEDDNTGLLSFTREWEILRLKEEEMWVKSWETDILGVETLYEIHFAQKGS